MKENFQISIGQNGEEITIPLEYYLSLLECKQLLEGAPYAPPQTSEPCGCESCECK